MTISPFFVFCFILSSSYAAVQDFCVADYTAPQGPAGYSCINPANVTVDDFVYSGLQFAGNASNINKVGLNPAFVSQFAGVNGLGLSLARADLAVGGIIPLHTHRGGVTEIILVAQGTGVVSGFIASDDKAYVKSLNKGDIIVIPPGLLHFQVNTGSTPALVFAAFSSPDPGVQILENALFQSDLPTELIAQTTLLDVAQIKKLKRFLGDTS